MTAFVVIATIVTIIALDWGVRAIRRRAAGPAPSLAFDGIARSALRVLKGAFLAPGHTWARLTEEGEARIGLDGFAFQTMGTPDEMVLPAPGTPIEKGAPLLTAVRGRRKLTFPSPLSGTVKAVNAEGRRRDASSWLVELSPARIGAEIRTLLVGEEATGWITQEFSRFREFLVDGLRTAPATVTLPDGGLPAEGVLAIMPEETWAEFEEEFLSADF